MRKFHADGIRWFNTLDNLEQFIVEPQTSCDPNYPHMKPTKTNKQVSGYGPNKSCVFLLFYFIALTSLNMFVVAKKPTLLPVVARLGGGRNWCVFWGHKNYKNFFRLSGLIVRVCDWAAIGPKDPSRDSEPSERYKLYRAPWISFLCGTHVVRNEIRYVLVGEFICATLWFR